MSVYSIKLSNVPYASKAQDVFNFIKDEGIKDIEVFLSVHRSGAHRGETDGTAFVLLFDYSDISKCLRLNGKRMRDRSIIVEECELEKMKEYELVPTPSPTLFMHNQRTKPYNSRYSTGSSLPSQPFPNPKYGFAQYSSSVSSPYHTSNRVGDMRATTAFIHQAPPTNYARKRKPFEDSSLENGCTGNKNNVVGPAVETTYPLAREPTVSAGFNGDVYENSNTQPFTTVHTDDIIGHTPVNRERLFLKLFPVPRTCVVNDIIKLFENVTTCKNIIFVKYEAGPHVGKHRGEVLVEVISNQEVSILVSTNQLYIGTTHVMVVIPSLEEIETALWFLDSDINVKKNISSDYPTDNYMIYDRKSDFIDSIDYPSALSSTNNTSVDLASSYHLKSNSNAIPNNMYSEYNPSPYVSKNSFSSGDSYSNYHSSASYNMGRVGNNSVKSGRNPPSLSVASSKFNHSHDQARQSHFVTKDYRPSSMSSSNYNNSLHAHTSSSNASVTYSSSNSGPNHFTKGAQHTKNYYPKNNAGCFIRLTRIPSSIQTKDIADFFKDFGIVDRSITPHRSKIPGPYNDWTIRFSSTQEASKAMRNSKNKMIRNFPIEMSII